MTKLALLLLWLALTGGFAGWKSPAILMLNVAGWVTLVVWGVWSIRGKPTLTPIDYTLWAIIASMGLSTSLAGDWNHGPVKMGVWAGYWAFYRLAARWPDRTINRAGLLALAVYAPLALLPWENANVIAFNLVGLTLLALPAAGVYGLFLLGVCGSLLGLLGSIGGMLALLVAGLIHVMALAELPRPLATAALLPVIGGWWASPGSYSYRLQFWGDALKGFWTKPIFGLGPGEYYTLNTWPHAHNIALTMAAEGGIIGLVALGAFVWAVGRSWPRFPVWAAALVAGFAVWSLVDEPAHFWGPGFMLMMAISRKELV